MKKSYSLLCCVVIALVLISTGCKKKVKPLSERIAKAWTAESVKEGAATVYTRGGSSNTAPGYSNFRLNISASSVSYTEKEGSTFVGTWEVEGDSKLILKGLNPQPTGSGGVVEFSIVSIDDAKLVIKNLKASPKTGNTINEYTLTNP
ncbi:hypothetical protein [Dyadobacter sp. CY312]|uniref:hypothetical protein n=1 Tax=Dyadobacter sp. CY312 TaxID=2907303 RepID=UPI001F35776A|nr:hypothetical protein [Dyadobacter sp. CY312]MCE7042972.1 hypothetical protein [Dyadobacter sp. CY312]